MLHRIDYEEHVCDGFYDCWGEFPEAAPEGSSREFFPSVRTLKRLQLQENDLREVSIVGPHGMLVFYVKQVLFSKLLSHSSVFLIRLNPDARGTHGVAGSFSSS